MENIKSTTAAKILATIMVVLMIISTIPANTFAVVNTESTPDQPNSKTLYLDNTMSDWDTVYAYFFNKDGQEVGEYSEWPGEAMTKEEDFENIYSIVAPSEYSWVVFSGSSDNTTEAEEGITQTVDIRIEKDKNLYVISDKTEQDNKTLYTGSWGTIDSKPEIDIAYKRVKNDDGVLNGYSALDVYFNVTDETYDITEDQITVTDSNGDKIGFGFSKNDNNNPDYVSTKDEIDYDKKYQYKFSITEDVRNAKYTITAVNNLGITGVKTTNALTVDLNGPVIDNVESDGKKVSFTVTDNGTGVSSVKATKGENQDVELTDISENKSDICNKKYEFSFSDLPVTITATDKAKHSKTKDISLSDLDVTPPEISIDSYKTADDKDYTPDVWTDKAVTVNFKVTDNLSGVNTVSVKDDSGSTVDCNYNDDDDTYSFTVSNYQGKFTINAKDKVGNAADENTEEIKVDTTKPEIKIVSYKTADGKDYTPDAWTGNAVTVNFKVTDNLSGVDTGTISVKDNSDSSVDCNYDDDDDTYSFTVSNYQGKFTINAKDKAGNAADEIETGEIKVDTTKPEIKIVSYKTADGKDYTPDAWTGNAVTVNFKVTDNLSGVDTGTISVKDNSDSSVDCNYDDDDDTYSFTVSNYQGKFTINAKDKAGNAADEIETGEIKVDTTKPEIKIVSYKTSDGKDYTPDVWTGNAVTVNFKVTDNLSGVNTDTISVKDNSGSPVDCNYNDDDDTYSFTVSNYQGKFTINAKDKAENAAVSRETGEIKVDKTAPDESSIKFSFKKAGSSLKDQVLTFLTFGIYSNDKVNVTVEATDKAPSSGIKDISIKYGVDNQTTEVTKGTVDLNLNGYIDSDENNDYQYSKTFTLDVVDSDDSDDVVDYYKNLTATVTDNVGNSTTKAYSDDGDFEIVLTKEAPVIDFSYDNLKDSGTKSTKYVSGDKYWFGGDVKFDFTVTDNYSKIHAINVVWDKGTDAETDVTKYCTEAGTEATLATFTPYEQSSDEAALSLANGIEDRNLSTITVNVDTKNIPELKDLINGQNDGKHTFTITATGNNGEKSTQTVDYYLDTTKPDEGSIKFSFKKAGSSLKDQVLTFLTFGIYSNDKVNVTVEATDKAPSSGIKDISLTAETGKEITVATSGEGSYNQEDKTELKSYIYSKTFTLDVDEEDFTVGDSFYNDLTATVTDNVENTYKDTYNKEVVVTKKAPDISFSYDNLVDSGSAVTRYISDNKYWFAGDVKFDFTVTDNYSKIHAINVALDGTDITKDCKGAGTYTILDKIVEATTDTVQKDDKINEQRVLVDTSKVSNLNLADGKHTFTITATGNNGEKSTQTVDYYLDTTKPDEGSIKFSFKKAGSSLKDQVLTFLTFGIYSNDKVNVTVEATDKAPSSGIKDISLTAETGKEITVATSGEGSYNQEDKTELKSYTYSKTFTLDVDEKDFTNKESYYDDITAKVTDNVGNTSENTYNNGGNPEVVVTKKAPDISFSYDNLADSGSAVTRYISDNKYWFAGDVKFDFTVTDNYSKIHAINVALDGTDITEDCTGAGEYTTLNKTAEAVENPAQNDDAISARSVAVDTSKVSNLNLADGKHTFTITATGNNGEKSTQTVDYYLDTTLPVITDFNFAASSKTADSNNPANGSEIVYSQPDVTDYGYYFDRDTKVTVTANDGSGAGVQSIVFVMIPKNQKTPQLTTSKVNNNKADFVVPANFKGQIEAYAFDNVENNNVAYEDSLRFNPDNVVVETGSKHNSSSSITCEVNGGNSAPYRDNKGRALYKSASVPVKLDVTDTHSGLKEVSYQIISNTYESNVYVATVDKNGAITTNTVNNENIYDRGWTCASEDRDKNLVTHMTNTINVRSNSNNISIVVKIVDRAGHTSTKTFESLFSIDRTNPKVEVTFEGNAENQNYYKDGRELTILVTERNFDPDKFGWDGINTLSGVSGVDNQWTVSNLGANNEPDDNTVYTKKIFFNGDEDYSVSLSCLDMADNQSNTTARDDFVVDKTDPTAQVTFNPESSGTGEYFDGTRTATITINEHNFNASDVVINQNAYAADNSSSATPPSVSSWRTSGDVHTATITFSNSGRYNFTVDFTDLSGRTIDQIKVDDFYIDNDNPEIKFENVENKKAYSSEIDPSVVFSDNNYDRKEIKLTRIDVKKQNIDVTSDFDNTSSNVSNKGETITYSNFDNVIDNDGIYLLSATAYDKSGRSTSEEIMFSVNRFGSTYMAGDKATEQLVDSGYTKAESDVIIRVVNATRMTGQKVTISTDSNKYRTLEQNKDYTVETSSGEKIWTESVYTINKSNFEKEGRYTVTVMATDAVKHTSSNRDTISKEQSYPVTFIVDKTEPIVRITGVENNKPYSDVTRDVKIVCEDTYINPDSLVVEYNGKKLSAEKNEFVVEDNSGSVTVLLTAKAVGNEERQSISVSVNDYAGWNTNGKVEGFILEASLLTRFLANTPLVITTFSILGILVVVAIIIIVKRRKKQEA